MDNRAKTVLVVEDEPAISDTIQYALSTENFIPKVCHTGIDALAIIKAEPIDFVILDIGLPDTSGFEVCKQIRRFSNIPILILTARSDEVDRIVGLEIGADDYVTKPFSPRELTTRVKAILRRTHATNHLLQSNNPEFEIDEQGCTIKYMERLLSLTRYEYGVLKLLVNAPGRVYSREQIMDAVWTEPGASFDRTVDAHIKMLRVKLREIQPEHNPIVTRRGLGYLYEPQL